MKKRKFEWGYLLILPGIGYIVFMIFVAVYMMVMRSFGFYNYVGESAFSLDFWKNVVNQQFIDSLLFSLKIGVLSSLISILICYVLATYLQKAWGGKVLLTIIRIPYFIPALVAAFLIVNVIDYHGILNQFLMAIHLIDEPLQLRNDDWGLGVLIIQIWKNVPLPNDYYVFCYSIYPKGRNGCCAKSGGGPRNADEGSRHTDYVAFRFYCCNYGVYRHFQ